MRVVVLGAGYAGLTLTRELEGKLSGDVELILVDETGTHVVQHELHRLIRRPGLADEIELALEDLLSRATLERARVLDVDPDARTVELEDGETIEYDVGAICLGAAAAFHGLAGLADHATPLKRIEDARTIRAAVRPVIENEGHIVVGGAGLSGVQVAGELAEMRARADSGASISLVEQRETVAPDFDDDFQAALERELETRDVAIRTGAKIEGADDESVGLADGESVGYDELIWTGGIRGDDAMDRTRPAVRSDLQLSERTFVLGDAARVRDDHGERVPASAQTAIGQARVTATNVTRLVDHHSTTAAGGSFTPRLDRYTVGQPRWLVTVGDGAVAQIGDVVLTGRAALAIKTGVGAGYLGRIGPIRNAVDLVRSELGVGDGASESEADDGRPDSVAVARPESGQGPDAGDTDDPPDADEFDRLPESVVEELTDDEPTEK